MMLDTGTDPSANDLTTAKVLLDVNDSHTFFIPPGRTYKLITDGR